MLVHVNLQTIARRVLCLEKLDVVFDRIHSLCPQQDKLLASQLVSVKSRRQNLRRARAIEPGSYRIFIRFTPDNEYWK